MFKTAKDLSDYIDLKICEDEVNDMEIEIVEAIRKHLEIVIPIYERMKACSKQLNLP